jgi:hypothetical protein
MSGTEAGTLPNAVPVERDLLDDMRPMPFLNGNLTDIPRISGLLGRIFGLIEVRRNEIRSQPPLFAAQSSGRPPLSAKLVALPSLRHTSVVVVRRI